MAHRMKPRFLTALSLTAFTGMVGTAAAETSFADTANALCRQIQETRPYMVVTRGQQASTEVLAAARGVTMPDRQSDEVVSAALAAWRGEALRSHGELSALTPPAELAPSWQVMLEMLAAQAELSQDRLAWIEGRSTTIRPASDYGPDNDAARAAIDRLGFAHRDCELIGVDTGVQPEHLDFVRVVTAVCDGIIGRREAQGYDASADLSLDVFVAAHRSKDAFPPPGAEAALVALETEWRQGAADLATVSADLIPNPAAWQSLIGLFEGMAELQAARLAILRSGTATMADDYAAGPRPPVPDNSLEALGLNMTECRGIRF